MLKSILLRMLVFALAFGVGVGSNILAGKLWRLKPAQSHQIVEPLITFKFESSHEVKYALRLRYSLCNNSPNSIWYKELSNTPIWVTHYCENNQWTGNIGRCGTCMDESPWLIYQELKPHSKVVVEIGPVPLQELPLRVMYGVTIFWENPSDPLKIRNSITPYRPQGFTIWGQALEIKPTVTPVLKTHSQWEKD